MSKDLIKQQIAAAEKKREQLLADMNNCKNPFLSLKWAQGLEDLDQYLGDLENELTSDINQRDFTKRWYLSTEGYYFMYRPDKNDPDIIRATLFNAKTFDKIPESDKRISPGIGSVGITHHQLINHYEVFVMMRAL